MTKKVNKAVYIVMGRKFNELKGRFNQLLSLKKYYKSVTLILREDGQHYEDRIGIKSLPNPTGFLRIIGLNKLKKALDRYLYFPSVGVLYVGRMQRELERRIEEDIKNGNEICLIVSTPPHCVGLVGLKLKRKYPQINWIMDWTDLWSYDENYLNRTPSIYRERLFKLENRMLNECDMNVTTNAFARDVLIHKYHVPSQRVVSINHGFCRDDSPDAVLDTDDHARISGNDEIKIGFFGTLFKPPRVPGDRVVEAIGSIRKKGINVVLHNYGIIPEEYKNSGLNHDDGIVYHGTVDYKDGLKAISQCDFQLLVLADLPNSKAVMSIKIPDYFLVNKPIIAIVPEPSAISDIINKTNSGFVIPANGYWSESLEALLRRIMAGETIPKRNIEEIDNFDWEVISRQWVNVISNNEASDYLESPAYEPRV
jgi:glycosyltransferase involved in cell wall biosynthesis